MAASALPSANSGAMYSGVPAALLLFPPRYNAELRKQAGKVCTALADSLDGNASKQGAAMLVILIALCAVAFPLTALLWRRLSTERREVAFKGLSIGVVLAAGGFAWFRRLFRHKRADAAALVVAPVSATAAVAPAIAAPPAEPK